MSTSTTRGNGNGKVKRHFRKANFALFFLSRYQRGLRANRKTASPFFGLGIGRKKVLTPWLADSRRFFFFTTLEGKYFMEARVCFW